MTKILSNLEILLQKKFLENDVFTKCITHKGKTQLSESIYMPFIRESFYEAGMNFDESSSQRPKDIRVLQPSLNFEVKKTDNTTIILNDTAPSKDIYYIYILTGTKKYKPQIKIINGYEFIKDNEWYLDYVNEINKIKDLYCRGNNKKCKKTPLKCYIRPTWSVDLTHFNLITRL